MKRNTLLFLFLLCGTVLSVAQQADMTIKGKIDGIKKGRLYLLARSSEETTDTLGFCDFKRGKFVLTATAAEPVFAQLVVDGFSGGFTFFAEPGVEYEAFLTNDDRYYIKGGTLNDSYVAHMRISDSLSVAISDMQERYDALRAERKFRSASLLNDTLQSTREYLKNITLQFLSGNDNIITAYTIYSNIIMRNSGLNEIKSLYSSLGDGARSSLYGRMIKERLDRLAQTVGGAKAPDFTLPDINGNPVTMSAVSGKIKIIDFWASWCGPCRLNNPALRALYDEFHEKGLEIIGVSLDTDKAAWARAIEKDGLVWVNVSSLAGWDCETISLYNITGVPSLYVLDENNNIIATGLRGEQLKMFLRENLE